MTSENEKIVHSMAFEYELLASSYSTFHLTVGLMSRESSDILQVHAYRTYAQVIQHLYEFMRAQVEWQYSKTKADKPDEVEKFISLALIKATKDLNGESLSHEQSVQFANELRLYRNKVSGHALRQRFTDYPLSEFYSKYNVYISRLVNNASEWWTTDYSQLANQPAIQEFAALFDFE